MPAANWMKRRREALDITQEQFVQRLAQHGILLTKAAVSKWEIGKTPLPLNYPNYRRAIADVLEMTIPELLAAAGYELGDTWSPEAQYVATLFDMLPEDVQNTVIELLAHLKTNADLRQNRPNRYTE